MINRLEELSSIVKTIMLEQPFYGLFLLNINKDFNERVPTAGVSLEGINYRLTINPKFWDSLSDDHKQGLVLHEALHIVFNHLILRDDFQDKYLANVAMDCELNQYIEPHLLPEGAILPSTLEEKLGVTLDKKAGTHYYYNAIAEAQKDCKGQCGGGEGGEGLPDTLDDHDSWGNSEDLSEAEKKLIEKQNDYLIKEAAEQTMKSRGYIPGEIQEIYKRITKLEEAKFNWKAYLRQFVNGTVRSHMKTSRKKINRRLEKEQVPGKKYLRKINMLVGIDTSGSVSNDELQEFMNEIHHIHKNGADVTIVQCDTKINSIDKFDPKMNINIKGRGGTYFEPVIEYYNKNRNTHTCLVYFTDGEASCDLNPQGKMLWVMSSQSQINQNLPGPKIKLN